MARRPSGDERKQVYSISMEPRVAAVIMEMGDGSISAGFHWMFNQYIALHSEGELGAIVQARKAHAAALVEKAAVIDAAARERAARKKSKGPTKAQKEFTAALDHYIAINAGRFARGEPLYSMAHMSSRPDLVAAVYADANAKYGWEFGPRPPSLAATAPSAAARTAAEVQHTTRKIEFDRSQDAHTKEPVF